MAQMNMQLVNDNTETHIIPSASPFSEGIKDALHDCQQARGLLLTISNEINEIPTAASSSVRNYCSIGLHVNSALQASIRGIGHGRNMVGRLRTMLNPEQRNELSSDLHGMQMEMVTTCTECEEADRELWRSLRHAVHEDPLLSGDAIAVQCVDAIEQHHSHLHALPISAESIPERSNTIDSIQTQLNLLEGRVEDVSPNTSLAKFVKILQKTFKAMNHLIKGVIKSLDDTFDF